MGIGVWVPSMKGKEKRKEREEKIMERRNEERERGEKRGEWVTCFTWTPSLHYITIILTLFNHFNGLSYDIN